MGDRHERQASARPPDPTTHEMEQTREERFSLSRSLSTPYINSLRIKSSHTKRNIGNLKGKKRGKASVYYDWIALECKIPSDEFLCPPLAFYILYGVLLPASYAVNCSSTRDR